MNNGRFCRVFSLFEGMIKRADVVAVDRTDISKAHVVEHRGWHQSRLNMALNPIREIVEMMANCRTIKRFAIPRLKTVIAALRGDVPKEIA